MTPDTSPLDVDTALDQLLALLPARDPESVSIHAAIGRALSEDVVARRTLPPWDNSAMDGYAVRASDTATRGAALRIQEVIHAGKRPERALTPGTCARIMTGAPLPPGADAVVMQERTRRAENAPPLGEVEILEAVSPGQHVRRRGEDTQSGSVLLPRGTALGIPEAALLWAQGLREVKVPKRPRVAVLSTGDELCDWDTLKEGEPSENDDRLVDTNSLALAAAIERAGGHAQRLGIARDSLSDVQRLLRQAEGFDLVLTSAGISVGEHDFVKEALEREGVTLGFWRVAMKPGKPLAVGRKGNTLFVGLPGNPTSSLVTFEIFVRPLLLRALGHEQVKPRVIPGVSAEPYQKAPGLTHFVRVKAQFENNRWVASPLSLQSSGALRSVALATHLMRVPQEKSGVSAGEEVELLPVSWSAF